MSTPIYGARGTSKLPPEFVPRSSKRTRRAQPYRRRKPRIGGPTLTAMLRGRPAYLPNPMDVQRHFLKKKRGR